MSIFDQKVIKYEMKPLSSLEKVFPDETPVYRMECQMLSGLWGETVSFQVAYTGDFVMRERLDVRVVSELAEHVHVRTVEMVPVGRIHASGAAFGWMWILQMRFRRESMR